MATRTKPAREPATAHRSTWYRGSPGSFFFGFRIWGPDRTLYERGRADGGRGLPCTPNPKLSRLQRYSYQRGWATARANIPPAKA